MGYSSVQKVSRSGKGYIVNIPKRIVEIMEIELGDFLKIDWLETIKMKKKGKKDREEKEKTNKKDKITKDDLMEIKRQYDEDEKEEEDLPDLD